MIPTSSPTPATFRFPPGITMNDGLWPDCPRWLIVPICVLCALAYLAAILTMAMAIRHYLY
jgi:hypothetical protein